MAITICARLRGSWQSGIWCHDHKSSYINFAGPEFASLNPAGLDKKIGRNTKPFIQSQLILIDSSDDFTTNMDDENNPGWTAIFLRTTRDVIAQEGDDLHVCPGFLQRISPPPRAT